MRVSIYVLSNTYMHSERVLLYISGNKGMTKRWPGQFYDHGHQFFPVSFTNFLAKSCAYPHMVRVGFQDPIVGKIAPPVT